MHFFPIPCKISIKHSFPVSQNCSYYVFWNRESPLNPLCKFHYSSLTVPPWWLVPKLSMFEPIAAIVMCSEHVPSGCYPPFCQTLSKKKKRQATNPDPKVLPPSDVRKQCRLSASEDRQNSTAQSCTQFPDICGKEELFCQQSATTVDNTEREKQGVACAVCICLLRVFIYAAIVANWWEPLEL